MLASLSLLLIIVNKINLSDCADNDWALYDAKFKGLNREEIFIANVTADLNFNTNFAVEKWKTMTVGDTCYTAGVTNNNTELAILFSTIAANGTGMEIVEKRFDLEINISDIELFQERKNGNQTIWIVVYSPNSGLIWYSLHDWSLNKRWIWPMQALVSHFSIFKMNNENFLLTSVKTDAEEYAAVIYGFNSTARQYWYYQSISLNYASPSSCLSVADTDYYLTIVQPNSNQLLLYHFHDEHFVLVATIESLHINQVVCFENGFESFIAFNGFNASIYEVTLDGLKKREVTDSNLEGIQFWIPIPVNTYRDETILMCQRKLDHGTHHSFDVDVVTYNGKKFEEHEDVPCTLFGETQNGLKCLTEYNSNTGMEGTSYIATQNHLALIVPRINSSSLLFNLEIGVKKIEHPAKTELEMYLNLKKTLQALIDDQKEQLNKLPVKHKVVTNQLSAPKIVDNFARSQSHEDESPRFNKLKNEVIEVVKEIEILGKKVKDQKPMVQGGKYGTLIFNGPVQIQSELSAENVYVEDEEFIDLLEDIARRDHLLPFEGHKTFEDLTVSDLAFENVNGLSGSEFLINRGSIGVNGSITFENVINVQDMVLSSGIVNNDDINSWVNVNNYSTEEVFAFEELIAREKTQTEFLNNEKMPTKPANTTQPSLENVTIMDSLFIPGNVTVKTLNGHDFEVLLRKLCFTHIKCHIPNLTVSGVMNIRDDAVVDILNGLKFPEDFIGLEPNETLIITGSKTFKNITRGYKVTTNNSVNGMDLSKMVTLSEDQVIPGTFVFENLEVIDGLNVYGKVKGEVEKFVPNIGLRKTTNIKSNVDFFDLEVLGDIIVKNNINNTKFSEYLDNIVTKDENATITGTKQFPQGFTALKNIHISSNSINNISLESIITTDDAQDLYVESIVGNVDFDHLYVKGIFDGENVTELNATLIKLNENRTLNFLPVFFEDFSVDSLIVNEDYNEKSSVGPERQDDSNISFEHLEVEDIMVEGDIIGNIENIDINDLKLNYLKYIDDQTISEPYNIDELTSHTMNIEYINNVDFKSRFSYSKFRENITDILTYRNGTVEVLNVEGDVTVMRMNDEDFKKILEDHAWTKIHRNSTQLTIDGDVYFENLEIEKLADAPFKDYITNLVFKNETDIHIGGHIVFENGIRVRNLIETQLLNGIPLDKILRRVGEQTVVGPIEILGSVTIEDSVTVKEMINNVEVAYMLNNFDMGEESLKVKGEVLFQRMPYIRNLTITGLINGESFEKLKSNLVYINDDIYLDEDILFNNTVHINGNLGVSKDINGIVLSEFVPRVAWLTQDATIEGPVKFTHSTDCYKSLGVENEMKTMLLFGQDLEEHVRSGVFVNKGLLQGSFHFEDVTIHENLQTKFVGNLDIDAIIPLKTLQQMDELNIGDALVVQGFDVGNKVNGVNLMVERDRTFLSNVQQHVPSEIVFMNNVLIENSLLTPIINNKPSSKIVYTNTDQNLTATYNFNTKCFEDEHLIVTDLINGVNLTYWQANLIQADSEQIQHIKEKWMVMENLNLVGPLKGDGIMTGMNITQLVQDIQQRQEYLCHIEKGIEDDFENLCEDMTYIYKNTKKQIHKFKYFEGFQTISLDNKINYVKYFQHLGNHYLLVNEARSCFTDLMVFKNNGFLRVRSIHTGGVSQIEVVKDKTDLLLVSRGMDKDELTCNIVYSTVVWKWADDNIEALATIENQELLQESQVPLTFYGLRHGYVTEFKIDTSKELTVQEYRKWEVLKDNARFIPRGLKTGLAMATGKNAIFLRRDSPIIDEEYSMYTTATIRGNITQHWNSIIPGRSGGNIAVVNVGVKGSKKTLLAVARHKETEVKHRMDIIEIYSDPLAGNLFDNILSYKPTALTSLELENGETLLAFMENEKILQVYEYKGIEGFKHRSAIKIQADRIFLMDLPIEDAKSVKVLGLVNNNQITLLQAVMVGNRYTGDLHCIN